MKHFRYLTIFFVLGFFLMGKGSDYPNMSFFEGNYDLIGKKINSLETYYGKAKIEVSQSTFKMTRVINNTTNVVFGVLNKDLPEGRSSLDFKFKQDGVNYVVYYRWYMDYDNHPLFSGFVSFPDEKPDQMGMEFLRISSYE